jgi:cytochrome c nitrite reductase small subunit
MGLAATKAGPSASPAARALVLSVPLALGALVGVGGYTFGFAQGFSYFSSDPRPCANCHIMRPQYDSWQKASHHGFATCADCHLPAALPAKLLAKASNGYHHSRGFTLQDFHEPIRIKPPNAAILEANCLRCHQALVQTLRELDRAGQQPVACVHCHFGVGHGETAGLGPPDDAPPGPPLSPIE